MKRKITKPLALPEICRVNMRNADCLLQQTMSKLTRSRLHVQYIDY